MAEREAPDGRSMSEILASIRRIVSDEERARREAERRREAAAGGSAAAPADPPLELSPAMRIVPPEAPRSAPFAAPLPAPLPAQAPADDDPDAPLDLGAAGRLVSAPPHAVYAPPPAAAAPSVAEIEEIVRRVVREELKGPIGLEISRKVKASIREEVRRILDEDEEPLV